MDHCNHKCMVETSCCGLSLRTGSLLSGVYLLLAGIAMIVASFMIKGIDTPHKIFFYVLAVLSLIGAVTLLFGSFKCSRTCIKIGRIILFILTVIAGILLVLALLTMILNLFSKIPIVISIQKFLNWDMQGNDGKGGKGGKPPKQGRKPKNQEGEMEDLARGGNTKPPKGGKNAQSGEKAPIGKSLMFMAIYLVYFLVNMYLFAVVNSFFHSLCQNCV